MKKGYIYRNYFLIFLIIFFIPPVLFAETITFNLEPHFFMDNTEYVDPYVKSEMLMGTSLKSFFTFRQTKNLTLNLGVYGIFFYGEEEFLSDVKPLASYIYNLEDVFSFTIGYLNNENRHNMLEALQKEQLEYTRQIDYGFQTLLMSKYSRLDLWLNWNLLNTPEHKEYLDLGTNLYVYVSNFIFNAQIYWSHHGGTLYDVGIMQNNYSMALGLENYYALKNRVFNKIGYKAYFLGDLYEPGFEPSSRGYGIFGELYFYVLSFKLYLDYWYGNNFITEEGNPLYRHDELVIWGVRNESKISNITDLIVELRFHYINDTNVFSYQYRFEFQTSLGYKVK